MTQAFNLSQLANNLNTSGQLDATDGLAGVVPFANLPTITVAKGGTNLTATPTNGQIPIGNGSGYSLATVTAGSGISVTNGAGTITIATAGGGGVTSLNGQTGAITNNTLNSIGSYAVFVTFTSGQLSVTAGSTYSGSQFQTANLNLNNNSFNFYASNTGNIFSGTWRYMGGGGSQYPTSCGPAAGGGGALFVRIS